MHASEKKLSFVESVTLPEVPSPDAAYRLLPNNPDETYYQERINRNLGWITPEEQALLRTKTIGVAGCGGMGGLLASIFIRAGVGEVRIADCETFDVSNINRQFGAQRETVGESKAFVTARLVRAVSDDTSLVVYPQGIDTSTIDSFLDGCDVVCDEIEFWAVGSRILLHQEARRHNCTVFNCNTVGFSTNLFLFEPDGYTMEECLDFSLAEAEELQKRIQNGTATTEEKIRVRDAVLHGLVPFLPEYCPDDPSYRTAEQCRYRLLEEQKAPIIATNPPLASGLLADHILLHLVRSSSLIRTIPPLPRMPQYFHFDAALMLAETRDHRGDAHV